MGFFDPAWKKLLAKSPPAFREKADVWLISIEDVIAEHKMVGSVDNFRTAVLCHLAIEWSEKDPSPWSEDALTYAKLNLFASSKVLPEALQQAALRAANILRHIGGP